jgi:hypothetical protein
MKSRPVLDITTRAAKVEIRRHKPQLKIRHTSPKMTVNKKAPTFSKKRVVIQRGKKAPVVQVSQRFIHKPVTHMSKVANILANKNDMPINNEERKSLVASLMEEPIETVIPKEDTKTITDEIVQLEWDKGYFEIEWSPDMLDIDWDVDMFPEIVVEPHAVEIRVRNYDGSIKNNINKKILSKTVGVKVDKKV